MTASGCDFVNRGGNVTIRGLYCRTVSFYPKDGGLYNVLWDGGEITGGIYFDAGQNNIAGNSTASRISIKHVSGIPLNFVVMNGPGKFWNAGATAIDISENAPGKRATRGSAQVTSSSISYTVSDVYLGSQVFYFTSAEKFAGFEISATINSAASRYPILFTPYTTTERWELTAGHVFFHAYPMNADLSTFKSQGLALPLSVTWRLYA